MRGKIKIKYKLIVFISLVISISIIPLTIIILFYNQNVITNKTLEICKNLSYNVSSAATEELIVNITYDATQTVIKNLEKQEIIGLERAYVLNYQGAIVAYYLNQKGVLKNSKIEVNNDFFKELRKIEKLTYLSKKIEEHNILEFISPIYIQYYDRQVRLGEVIFDFNEDLIYKPIESLRNQIIMFSSVAFFISIFITLFVSLKIVKPIQVLTEGAKIFGEGNLSHRITLITNDEIGDLAFTFNYMADKIQDFTQNLEEKVKQRTEELNQSLKKVQELKTQQDGDYYLTSLLLQPFIGNHNTSINIKTEFIIRQKKQFTFKKWQSEIGGDYCFTSTIKLGGKNFLFFINADAMGKSIQGAGGLLVLGSVINSVVLQAKHNKATTELPEIWMKNLYLDLQSIFLSFEGTMYISCVFGLIDEECGFMYFTNVEHPFTILYRNQKAQFLEEENLLKKLGVIIEKQNFALRTYLLQPNDVIFIGSDGKDDLIYLNEKNEEVINEDEFLILKIIEKNRGELKEIFDYIFSNYKVIDDISILRIEFIKKTIEYSESIPEKILDSITELRKDILDSIENNKKKDLNKYFLEIKTFEKYLEYYPAISFHLGNLYYLLNDYQNAYENFYYYYKHFPFDNDLLYAISKTLWNLDKKREAIDFAEMLYLRDPQNINNIIHLIKMYTKSNIFSRSEDLIDSLKELNYPINELENLEKELKKAKMEYGISKDISSLTIKGFDYYQNKKYKKAIEVLEEALKFDPENTEILFKLANSYAQIKNFLRAKEYYEEVLKITPNNSHVLNNLAVIYYKFQEYEKARICLEKSLQINPLFSVAEKNLKKLLKKTTSK